MEDEQAVNPVNIEQDTPASSVQPVVNDPYDLDLDLLLPRERKVKLNNKVYSVRPPTVKDIATLARLSGKLQSSDEYNLQENVNEMMGLFEKLMPALKEDGVDLTTAQMMALYGFVNTIVSPADNSALKSAGLEPTTEKKIQAA